MILTKIRRKTILDINPFTVPDNKVHTEASMFCKKTKKYILNVSKSKKNLSST